MTALRPFCIQCFAIGFVIASGVAGALAIAIGLTA
jgi:hypothetical protein